MSGPIYSVSIDKADMSRYITDTSEILQHYGMVEFEAFFDGVYADEIEHPSQMFVDMSPTYLESREAKFY